MVLFRRLCMMTIFDRCTLQKRGFGYPLGVARGVRIVSFMLHAVDLIGIDTVRRRARITGADGDRLRRDASGDTRSRAYKRETIESSDSFVLDSHGILSGACSSRRYLESSWLSSFKDRLSVIARDSVSSSSHLCL